MGNEIESQSRQRVKGPSPAVLRQFVYLAVKSGEVARTNPYKSSLSTGKSGLAFGKMQHDTGSHAENSRAQEYFKKILDADVAAGHLARDRAQAIYKTALTKPRSLGKGDIALVDAALMRQKALVDEVDKLQLDAIMKEVERALQAAERNPNGPGELDREHPSLGFIAELAMWSNRTGDLVESSNAISKMPRITQAAFTRDYLSQQRQFTRKKKPESWPGWRKKVKRAVRDAEQGIRTAPTPAPTPTPGAEGASEATSALQPYASPNGNSGVVAYRIDGDSITLRFVDRSTLYLYDANRPGLAAVYEMQRLAKRGTGLTTYINRHVRNNYALKFG